MGSHRSADEHQGSPGEGERGREGINKDIYTSAQDYLYWYENSKCEYCICLIRRCGYYLFHRPSLYGNYSRAVCDRANTVSSRKGLWLYTTMHVVIAIIMTTLFCRFTKWCPSCGSLSLRSSPNTSA